jgi:hypothetical protein
MPAPWWTWTCSGEPAACAPDRDDRLRAAEGVVDLGDPVERPAHLAAAPDILHERQPHLRHRQPLPHPQPHGGPVGGQPGRLPVPQLRQLRGRAGPAWMPTSR